jgi:hypothetical protein
MAEARARDAGAVRRAPRPRRRDDADRRVVHLRPRAAHRPLPRVPHATRERRGLGARRAVPARSRAPRDAGHAAGPRPARARARDDRAARVLGVLPDGGRHRCRHQGDGDPLRVPGERRGFARVPGARSCTTWCSRATATTEPRASR